MDSMTFHWSTDIGDFFIKGLTINTTGSFIGLCVVLGLLSVFYEAMKVHSAKVRARAARERLRASSCAPSETANLLSSSPTGSNASSSAASSFVCKRDFFKLTSEACLFLLQNVLGYGLMLSVMIYNGYLFIVVVLSMGLGYFLFGHISMRVNMENMQARTTNVICSPICEPQAAGSSHSSGAARGPTTSGYDAASNCNQAKYATNSSTVRRPIVNSSTTTTMVDHCSGSGSSSSGSNCSSPVKGGGGDCSSNNNESCRL